ncbi:hypothetical protein COTS27_00943 [Spirochaetota bacterium]|nr:hypothetical protein COTS27_00943 [Spirochaetota bacterium]
MNPSTPGLIWRKVFNDPQPTATNTSLSQPLTMIHSIFKKNITSSLKREKLKKSSPDLAATTSSEHTTPQQDVFATTLATTLTQTKPPPPTTTLEPIALTSDQKKLISKLIGNLGAAGEVLTENPSLTNYARYKSALQSLLETTLPKSYTIAKQYSAADADKSQKEYHIITTTSKELSSLLSLIKETHQDTISIAAKINDIKGLIIDYLY